MGLRTYADLSGPAAVARVRAALRVDLAGLSGLDPEAYRRALRRLQHVARAERKTPAQVIAELR